MFEYKFIKIPISGFLKKEPMANHQEIIREYAEDGWRLVQIFAPAIHGYGAAKHFEIILEREVFDDDPLDDY